jgi:hypothetical protein
MSVSLQRYLIMVVISTQLDANMPNDFVFDIDVIKIQRDDAFVVSSTSEAYSAPTNEFLAPNSQRLKPGMLSTLFPLETNLPGVPQPSTRNDT